MEAKNVKLFTGKNTDVLIEFNDFLSANVANLKIYDTKLTQNNYGGVIFISVLLTFDYIVEPIIEEPTEEE